jgi:hypothetical protein
MASRNRIARKQNKPRLQRDDRLYLSAGFDRLIAAVEQDFALRRRWKRQYCRGVSLVLKIPGGRDYAYDRRTSGKFVRYIWDRDPGPAAAILALTLTQLGRPGLIDKIPRARRLATHPLHRNVRYRIRRTARPQLVGVAIDCLDRLLIAPVLPGYRYHRDGCVLRPLPPKAFPRFM